MDGFWTDMTDTLSGKTAILGVGAQKCGTSWLNDYLTANKRVASTAFKELHFFDAWLNRQDFKRFDTWFIGTLRDVLHRHGGDAPDAPLFADALDRVRSIYAPETYLELFRRKLRPGQTHFIDMTPSYSMLTAEQFRTVARYFRAADVRVKVVFLMRDPVERHYSALRMRERESRKRGQTFSALANFEPLLHQRDIHIRTRYDLTIRAVLEAFPEADCFFGFYEDMFTHDRLQALTDFLGLPFRQPDFSYRRNASPRHGDLTQAQIDSALSAFAPTYRFCRERFGARVPREWKA